MEPKARRTRLGCCMLGCLTPLGAVTGLVLLWMTVLVVTNDGVPRPVKLDPTMLVGTWKGGGGSTLVLRPDGTFVATAICGMGYDEQQGSGTGDWTGSKELVQNWSGGTSVALESAGVDDMSFGEAELDVTGSTADPVLWSYEGDPDDDEVCLLHRVATDSDPDVRLRPLLGSRPDSWK